MGKVGSSSIYRTLKKNNFFTIHTHSHEEAEYIIKKYRGKIYLITGIREPLTRNISAFFQNINNKNNKYWYIGNKIELKKLNVGSLIKIFNERVDLHIREIVAPWFDNFYKICKVKKEDFISASNIYTFNKDNLEIIIYKLENFKDFEEYFFKRFSDIFPFNKFYQENLASSKDYSNLYKEFKRLYFIDNEKYQNLYSQIDHISDYYDAAEIYNY